LISSVAGMLWGIDLNQELQTIAYLRAHPGCKLWVSQTFMECLCANLKEAISASIYTIPVGQLTLGQIIYKTFYASPKEKAPAVVHLEKTGGFRR
jgi:hypothetical protein